jgi:prepilin-type processing-associated H-X9-DG protein
MSWLTDGSATTIAFAERVKGSNSRSRYDPGDVFRRVPLPGSPRVPILNPAGYQALKQMCKDAMNKVGTWDHRTHAGRWWHVNMYTYSNVNIVFTPNSPIPDCFRGGCGEWDCHSVISVRSMHPGGANVLMFDGSVHFISDGINERVWWALGSAQGGENIDKTVF